MLIWPWVLRSWSQQKRMSMAFDIFAWEWFWSRPPQWCCQFGAWWGVVSSPSWWGRLSGRQNIWHWYGSNLFWPQPLIPQNFPLSCKWRWWLHCLVGRLNFHSNSGVHWLGYWYGWKRGKMHHHGFTISCHLPCSRRWQWVGRLHNLVATPHLHRFFQLLWPALTPDFRVTIAVFTNKMMLLPVGILVPNTWDIYPSSFTNIFVHIFEFGPQRRTRYPQVPAWAKVFDRDTSVFSIIRITGSIPQFRNPEKFWKGR